MQNNDEFFSDIYIHLHESCSAENQGKIEHELRAANGVFSIHIDAGELHDAIMVAYDPGTITAETLLEIVRKRFANAVNVASMQQRVISH